MVNLTLWGMIRKTSSSVLLRSSIISIRPCQGQERSPIERIPTFEDDDKKREDFTTRAKNIKPDPVIPHLQKKSKAVGCKGGKKSRGISCLGVAPIFMSQSMPRSLVREPACPDYWRINSRHRAACVRVRTDHESLFLSHVRVRFLGGAPLSLPQSCQNALARYFLLLFFFFFLQYNFCPLCLSSGVMPLF